MSDPQTFEPREVPQGFAARNTGDDAEAAAEHNSRFVEHELGTPEHKAAPSNRWRPAECLLALRDQVNAMAPRRDKDSDGMVGDASHQSRSSDHNPWVRDGNIGVVTAMDITHDPDGGCDAGVLAETLRTSKDKRIKYIIWNRRISASEPKEGQPPWAWRRYTGSNPHNHHMHLSVLPEKALYDARDPWTIKPAPAPSAGEAAVAAASPAPAPASVAASQPVAATSVLAAEGGGAPAGPANPPSDGGGPADAAPETKGRVAPAAAEQASLFGRLARWLGLAQ